VIAIMSFAFFGQGMCNLGWTVITDVAPQRYLGLSAGIFNLCANLAGIIAPVVIGQIVAASGSFYGALVYVSLIALLGVLAYVFILGEVTPVESPAA
jgi:ACS family D-galactonate transporter-like MFS transporter